MSVEWRIGVLGALRIERDRRVIAHMQDRMQEQLLAYLALAPRRPLDRHEIAGELWPDKPQALRNNRLAEVTVRLKRLLADHALPDDAVVITRRTMQLSSEVETDLPDFESLIASAAEPVSIEEALTLRAALEAHYGAGLLPAFESDWIAPERAHIEQRYAEALSALNLTPAAVALGMARPLPMGAASIEDFAPPPGILNATGLPEPGASRVSAMGPPPVDLRMREQTEPAAPPTERAEAPWRLRLRSLLELAEQAEIFFWGPARQSWVKQIEARYDELASGLDWAIRHDHLEGAARLAGAIWPYWAFHDGRAQGRRYLEQILLSLPESKTATYTKVLHGAAALAILDGDLVVAETRIRRARRLWEEIGSRERIARATNSLGIVLYKSGQQDEAFAALQESIALFRTMRQPEMLARSLQTGVLVDFARRDFEQASARLDELMGLAEQLEDPHISARALADRCVIAQHAEDWATAELLARESLAQSEAIGDRESRARALSNLAYNERKTGRSQDAQAHYLESCRLYRSVGDMRGVAEALLHLASLEREAGRGTEASAMAQQSADLFHACADQVGIAEAERFMAELVGAV